MHNRPATGFLGWPEREIGTKNANRCGNREKGIALFLVLWVLALLSVIVGEFCHTMRTDATMTWDFGQRTEAYYIAYAGMQKAIEQLVSEAMSPVKKKDSDDEEEEDQAPYFRLNYDNPRVPFGKGSFAVRIENDSGKININGAGRRLLEVMLRPFNLDKDQVAIIVDSILDWRDKDNLHRINGAEDDYYEGLPQPYECKDDYFDSVEELLLVRGVTKEIFYGGLKDMVTVYIPKRAGSRGARRGGRTQYNFNKINLNAAPRKVLAALPGMNEEAIKAIEEYRKEKDFTSVSELAQVIDADIYQSVAPYLTVNMAPYYTVKSTGYSGDGMAQETVSAVIQIDTTTPKRYVVVQWRDKTRPSFAY